MTKIKQEAYKILKKIGVGKHIIDCYLFSNDDEYGYRFKLKNGMMGKIYINQNNKIVFYN